MIAKLTDLKARRMKVKDRPLADGTVDGLRLIPGNQDGHGKWEMRYVSPVSSKRRDMGFGTYPSVSLSEARDHAALARQFIRAGKDPIAERKAKKATQRADADAMTFKKAALAAYSDHKDGWKNQKHAAQWMRTLEMYAFPKLGERQVDDLKARDFADMLRPIWTKKEETASRVRQRCDAVMEWCIAQEHTSANPVKSAGTLLPRQRGKRERVVRLPAMPWEQVPEFVSDCLQVANPSISALMLEFLILTAARSGEVRSMTWDEVNFNSATWIVPSTRMKAGVEHRVPLSTRAIQILENQRTKAGHPELVFPTVRGKVATDMILTKFLRDKRVASSVKGRCATAHGFRSSFRDWASENSFSQEAAERALSHTVKSSTEWSYHRTDLLDQRRAMMQHWSNFLCGKSKNETNVVNLARRNEKK